MATTFKQLEILHNHGRLVLKDGTITDGIAKGEVVSGGMQSRLFHVTSNKPFPVGEQMEWPIYSRRLQPTGGTAENDWKAIDGHYYVDACFF